MIASQFRKNDQGKLKLSEALELSPVMTYFHRSLESESADIMDNFLRLPGVHVVMVGPSGCSRVLYFRAERKGLADRLRVYPISSADFAVGRHMEELEKLVESIAQEENPRGIVINISCIDSLAVNDFDSIIRKMKKDYGVLVQVYHRGPLIRNRETSQSRFSDLFLNLLENGESGEKKHQVNLLSSGEVLPDDSPLLKMLLQIYPRESIKEFANLRTTEDLQDLTASELNILVGGFGFGIAVEMEKKWGIPFQALSTCFYPDEVHQVMKQLTDRLHVTWDFESEKKEFFELINKVAPTLKGKKIAIGLGSRSLELAWLLKEFGIEVQVILLDYVLFSYPFMDIPGYIIPNEKLYGSKLLEEGQDLDIYLTTNITYQMRREELSKIDIAIGSRAAGYCKNAKKIELSTGYKQGYAGINEILGALQ
ncbi:MAG: hypothetical protein KBF19_01925 [Negativicutes bacterium]|nr:hypothetical protein [Negativicutes bacterium]